MAERKGPFWTHSEALAYQKEKGGKVEYDRHWWVVADDKKPPKKATEKE